MVADRVILKIHMIDGETKRVNARQNVSVQSLIDEIRSKLGILEGEYSLYLRGEDEPMDPGRTLAQYGLKDEDELIFKEGVPRGRSRTLAMIESNTRERIKGNYQAYLEEERQGQIFEIQWQPAIIGRLYQMNPSKNRLLAVDLEGIRDHEYVSRHHACITERSGQFSIESLNARNPTFVNDREVAFGKNHILQPGDRIRVGKIVLVFNLR
ncbi:MAG: FHA domain-containing protein [Anaerolineales bacterium]|nr:FHA domain-containing protein [Anaerolineales bacterium]